MADTIEQKLFQAHELLKEVLECMDQKDPFVNDLQRAKHLLFLAGRNLPRNLLAYRPQANSRLPVRKEGS